MIRFFILVIIFFISVQNRITKKSVENTKINSLEYVVLNTNNGSDCVLFIKNDSKFNPAMIVVTGAEKVKFENGSEVNGVHYLGILEYRLSVANFRGRQILVSNFSLSNNSVGVGILCH